jgi:hypothetical protein
MGATLTATNADTTAGIERTMDIYPSLGASMARIYRRRPFLDVPAGLAIYE